MPQITILHEPTDSEPFVIIDKPSGLASAPLSEGEDSAFTQTAMLFPILYDVEGKKTVEHGLLHRIDTATRGLLLIASNQQFYDYLYESQQKGLFVKQYSAEIQRVSAEYQLDGFCSYENKVDDEELLLGVEIQSFFRAYGPKGKSVRPVSSTAGKAALKKSGTELYTTKIKYDGDNKVVCSIKKGYRHQVRCHLAWIGYPIKGDNLYNPLYKEGESLEFTASGFSFPSYTDSKTIFDFHL